MEASGGNSRSYPATPGSTENKPSLKTWPPAPDPPSFPLALAEASELRARQLGYVSWNAYIKALIRYDLMVQGEHTITRPISHMRLDEQDRLDSNLKDLTETGVGVRGQWLEVAIREIAGKERAEEIKQEIAKNLAKTARF